MAEAAPQGPHTFKLVLVGDGGTGKVSQTFSASVLAQSTDGHQLLTVILLYLKALRTSVDK